MAAGGGDAVRERVCERVEADSQPTMSQMCNIDTAWIHDRYVVGCAEVLQFVVVCCCLYLVSLDYDILRYYDITIDDSYWTYCILLSILYMYNSHII